MHREDCWEPPQTNSQLMLTVSFTFFFFKLMVLCLDILLTMEFLSSTNSGLYILTWIGGSPPDYAGGSPSFEMVNLDASGINNFGGDNPATQWEHVTFAPVGILEIPPGIPICYDLQVKRPIICD